MLLRVFALTSLAVYGDITFLIKLFSVSTMSSPVILLRYAKPTVGALVHCSWTALTTSHNQQCHLYSASQARPRLCPDNAEISEYPIRKYIIIYTRVLIMLKSGNTRVLIMLKSAYISG